VVGGNILFEIVKSLVIERDTHYKEIILIVLDVECKAMNFKIVMKPITYIII
jgi:hypothetical protein